MGVSSSPKMKLWIKLTIILIACVALAITGTEAIKCYKCGSGSSQRCNDRSLVPEECEGQYRGQKVDACEQSIDDKGDEKRTCIASRETMSTVTADGRPIQIGKCYMDVRIGARGFSLENKYKKFCTCYEDACNSVGKISYHLLGIMGSVALILGFSRKWLV